MLANLGWVCRPSWWVQVICWLRPGLGVCMYYIIIIYYFYYVFVNFSFSHASAFPDIWTSVGYQHAWLISHDFWLSRLQHPRNRQRHAHWRHSRGNGRRRRAYKGTFVIIFYNYFYHLMRNNTEHDKEGSKTFVSSHDPPPPCRRSKNEMEGDLHPTPPLHLSFWLHGQKRGLDFASSWGRLCVTQVGDLTLRRPWLFEVDFASLEMEDLPLICICQSSSLTLSFLLIRLNFDYRCSRMCMSLPSLHVAGKQLKERSEHRRPRTLCPWCAKPNKDGYC